MAIIFPTILFFLFQSVVHGETLVPCYFVFGDSLVDNGNNNDRTTAVKANYPPYGIDFPGGPTGRFTNGRNVADFIAEFLGFMDHIPPFATASGNEILNGVNYASGGAGILYGTGKQYGGVINLDEQLQNHQITINKTITILGNADSANKHLSQCIYSVGMGSNDYLAYATTITRPTPQQFAQLLIDQYSRQLRDLYRYGSRKVAVFGLGAIGCIPASLGGALSGPLCLAVTNNTSGVFNAMLKSLVDVLNKDLIGSNFIYVDTFRISVSDPSFNGFKNKNTPCCAVSGVGRCVLQGATCGDRTVFEYFDGFHPHRGCSHDCGPPSIHGPISFRCLSAQAL